MPSGQTRLPTVQCPRSVRNASPSPSFHLVSRLGHYVCPRIGSRAPLLRFLRSGGGTTQPPKVSRTAARENSCFMANLSTWLPPVYAACRHYLVNRCLLLQSVRRAGFFLFYSSYHEYAFRIFLGNCATSSAQYCCRMGHHGLAMLLRCANSPSSPRAIGTGASVIRQDKNFTRYL